MELFRDSNIDFISKRYIAFTLSGIVILAGIISLVLKKGPDLGIDFKGGVQIYIKFGIPLSQDPGDENATAITINSSELNSQHFKVGEIIKITEGNKTAGVHIKSITRNNGTAKIEVAEPLGEDFTQAAVIQPVTPIPSEEIKSKLMEIGYQATVTPSGVDEMLISVGATETTPVPLSANPEGGTTPVVSIARKQLQKQLFQAGDAIIIEEGKITETNDIKSVSTDGNIAKIELSKPLENRFTASATIRYSNVGRHIANYLRRAKSNWTIAPGGISISEVGPNIGKELRWVAILSIIGSMIGLLLYISWRFELRFAVGAIVALFHDVLVTLGLFSILSKEINFPTVAAFLTIVGYSLNDTIVVFDRIRENANLLKGQSYDTIINQSINQSLSRTIITSLTTFMVVLAIFLLAGPGELNTFALALIFGVIVGTYSSIFVASPILHGWHLSLQKREA